MVISSQPMTAWNSISNTYRLHRKSSSVLVLFAVRQVMGKKFMICTTYQSLNSCYVGDIHAPARLDAV